MELSEVGLALDSGASPVAAAPVARGAIRLAYDAGIRFFDAASAPDVAAAEWLLSTAFGRPEAAVRLGTRIDVVHPLGPRSNRPAGVEVETAARVLVGPPFERGEVRAAIDDHLRRIGRDSVDVLQLSGANPGDLQEGSLPMHLDSARAEDRIGCWGVFLPRGSEAAGLAASAADSGAQVGNILFNLIERDEFERAQREGRHRLSWVVRDPHAAGRLDGAFLRQSSLAERPGIGSLPPSVSRWGREYQEVVRLGFLTEGRHRTLGQAALQYVLAFPDVASVTPRLSGGGSPEEWRGALAAAPLSETELARVGAELREPSGVHSRSK
ncbi:MAG TPA: aldo/keto reductase [Thermoplasmata archaeon]|nr:aldo/keto reductase [Thermoplasmata archaeon]